MSDELRRIEFENYITYVTIAKSRKPKYYTKGSKIPKKYEGLDFNSKGILVLSDGTPVIANPKAVGTPKVKKINGQDFYKGWGHHSLRNTVVDAMKSFFTGELVRQSVQPITEYPVTLDLELYCPPGRGDWDLDNLWIYNKVIQDCLVDLKILPQDNIRFITKPGAPQLIPINEGDTPKIVLVIRKDDRQVIKDHIFYS